MIYIQVLLHTCQCGYKIFTCSCTHVQASTVYTQARGLCVCAPVHTYTHLSGILHGSNNGSAVLLSSFFVALKAISYLFKSLYLGSM